MSDTKATSDRETKTVNPWRTWVLWFVPLMALGMVAIEKFGFGPVMKWLVVLVIVMQLYQRYVKKRSWRSIMFGDHKPDA